MLLDADLNACITLPQIFEHSVRAGITRAIINQDQLPIFVSLRNDRFDRGRQKFVIRIKRWGQNRKERPIREGSRMLTQFHSFLLGNAMPGKPAAVFILLSGISSLPPPE